MDHVRDSPHLLAKFSLPFGVVEIVFGRELGPHPVDEPERPVGPGQVPPAERAIERRRQNGIEPDRVGVHASDELEPAGIGSRIGRKLGGKLPRQGRTQVHSVDIEAAPAPTLGWYFEVIAMNPRGDLLFGGPAPWRLGGPAVPVGVEMGEDVDCGVILGVEPDRAERCGVGADSVAPPPADQGEPVPAVGVGAVPLGDDEEQGVGVAEPVLAEPRVCQPDLRVEIVAEPVGVGEALRGHGDGIGPIGAPSRGH